MTQILGPGGVALHDQGQAYALDLVRNARLVFVAAVVPDERGAELFRWAVSAQSLPPPYGPAEAAAFLRRAVEAIEEALERMEKALREEDG